MAVCILLTAAVAGCASGPAFNHSSAASKSAIRAADEVGAGELPSAALYLQLAKEELERARVLAEKGEKEQAVSFSIVLAIGGIGIRQIVYMAMSP